VEASSAVLKLCGAQITGLILASQTTDIFYILCREGKTVEEAKSVIRKLTENVKILDVIADDAKTALDSDMTDYEDALLAYSAKRHKADRIITRNASDFINSPIPALSPQNFLEEFFSV
jgi:predicted nucleic acid-binding protein